jgi:hypothetical protein
MFNSKLFVNPLLFLSGDFGAQTTSIGYLGGCLICRSDGRVDNWRTEGSGCRWLEGEKLKDLLKLLKS